MGMGRIWILFLLWFSPLHYNHLVYLPVPLAVAAGVSLGRALARPSHGRALVSVVVALALAAGWTQQLHRVNLEGTPNTAVDVAAAAILSRFTKPSDYVVSDMPVAAVLAHRAVPGPLVELGYLRFYTRLVTPTLVLKTIDASAFKLWWQEEPSHDNRSSLPASRRGSTK